VYAVVRPDGWIAIEVEGVGEAHGVGLCHARFEVFSV
jgi:hypothetical protein